MAYRGTRHQLEARKAALLEQIEAIDEKLRLERGYLESRRREHWGAIGALWSRLATRAPRPVRLTRGDGSVAALERQVDALTRALIERRNELADRRGLVQRYDDELAARVADSEAARTKEAPPRSARRVGAGLLAPLIGVLMVIGQIVRVLFAPLLIVLSVASAIGGDGAGLDIDLDGVGEIEPTSDPRDARVADAVLGGVALLALAAGGGVFWWWLG